MELHRGSLKRPRTISYDGSEMKKKSEPFFNCQTSRKEIEYVFWLKPNFRIFSQMHWIACMSCASRFQTNSNGYVVKANINKHTRWILFANNGRAAELNYTSTQFLFLYPSISFSSMQNINLIKNEVYSNVKRDFFALDFIINSLLLNRLQLVAKLDLVLLVLLFSVLIQHFPFSIVCIFESLNMCR